MQIDLFPVKKHIPDYLAEYFRVANAGSYKYKEMFYSKVKPIVLNEFAEAAGFDLQTIKVKCRSCNGTGIYKHYHWEGNCRIEISREQCWHCSDGIYRTSRVVLRRYILNGLIYHIPDNDVPIEGTIFKNYIDGIIPHIEVNSKAAERAFLILLFKYNYPEFMYRAKRILEENCNAKSKWIKDLFSNLFRRKNTLDDLPF